MVLHLTAYLPAVTAGHHDVKQDDRRLLALEDLHRLVSVIRNRDLVAARLEIIPDDVRVVLVIVDDQNGGKLWVGHCSKVVREHAGGKVTPQLIRHLPPSSAEPQAVLTASWSCLAAHA